MGIKNAVAQAQHYHLQTNRRVKIMLFNPGEQSELTWPDVLLKWEAKDSRTASSSMASAGRRFTSGTTMEIGIEGLVGRVHVPNQAVTEIINELSARGLAMDPFADRVLRNGQVVEFQIGIENLLRRRIEVLTQTVAARIRQKTVPGWGQSIVEKERSTDPKARVFGSLLELAKKSMSLGKNLMVYGD